VNKTFDGNELWRLDDKIFLDCGERELPPGWKTDSNALRRRQYGDATTLRAGRHAADR
jgi:hypothetical protein